MALIIVDHLYAVVKDVHVVPNPEEIAAVEYIGMADLSRELQSGSRTFAPWFRAIAQTLLLGEGAIWRKIRQGIPLEARTEITRFREPLGRQ